MSRLVCWFSCGAASAVYSARWQKTNTIKGNKMETLNSWLVAKEQEESEAVALDKRFSDMQKRIDDLEEFLAVARIPDAQEWRRKELESNNE